MGREIFPGIPLVEVLKNGTEETLNWEGVQESRYYAFPPSAMSWQHGKEWLLSRHPRPPCSYIEWRLDLDITGLLTNAQEYTFCLKVCCSGLLFQKVLEY